MEESMAEMINLTAEDGHKLAAYKAAPTGKPRGALVVIQEIFGVNHHIKNVTDGFAKDGYLAIAPAIFDRVERGFETGYQQADIERGRAVRGKLSIDDTVKDIRAAVKEAQKSGLKIGVVGYCFGGTMAWLAATRIDGVAAAIAYYGGGGGAGGAGETEGAGGFPLGGGGGAVPPGNPGKGKQQRPQLTQQTYT